MICISRYWLTLACARVRLHRMRIYETRGTPNLAIIEWIEWPAIINKKYFPAVEIRMSWNFSVNFYTFVYAWHELNRNVEFQNINFFAREFISIFPILLIRIFLVFPHIIGRPIVVRLMLTSSWRRSTFRNSGCSTPLPGGCSISEIFI